MPTYINYDDEEITTNHNCGFRAYILSNSDPEWQEQIYYHAEQYDYFKQIEQTVGNTTYICLSASNVDIPEEELKEDLAVFARTYKPIEIK